MHPSSSLEHDRSAQAYRVSYHTTNTQHSWRVRFVHHRQRRFTSVYISALAAHGGGCKGGSCVCVEVIRRFNISPVLVSD